MSFGFLLYLVRDKQLIDKVQRRYSKTVANLTKKAYEDRPAILKLPILTSRRIFNDLVCTFKILNRKFNVDLSSIFVLADISHLS